MADPDLHSRMCLAALLVLLLGGRRKVVFGKPVHPRAMGVDDLKGLFQRKLFYGCMGAAITMHLGASHLREGSSGRSSVGSSGWKDAGRRAKALGCSLALPSCFKCD